MRTFIAVELDDQIKNYIYDKQEVVRTNSKRGNFSRKENFHLTLRFIGESSIEEIEDIKRAINETVKSNRPFNITLGKLGCFPRGTKKIIWIGINNGYNELNKLFGKLENNLEKQGFEREKRGLKPHITIAREVRLLKDFKEICEEIQIQDKIIPVTKISLMESTRVDEKLTYRPIYTKNLIIE